VATGKKAQQNACHEPLPIEHSVSAVATDMYRSA
jgi:hypothetical protein